MYGKVVQSYIYMCVYVCIYIYSFFILFSLMVYYDMRVGL